MNVALWITQVVLALAALAAGLMKLARSHDELIESMRWPEDFSAATVKLIGVAEVLAALGLVLPGLTGIAFLLTPLAAVGLILIQAGAIRLHIQRKESEVVFVNITLFAIAVFVAWGRFGPSPLG
jgi:uncharacterized membrane protein YphA (DoxX/SURF4 family)